MQEISISKPLFGGRIDFVIYDKSAKNFVEDAYREGIRLQSIFNFYDKESELSQLNKHRTMKVSKELYEVVKKALQFAVLTDGAYDISFGKSILQRKKDGSIIKSHCSYKDIHLGKGTISLKHPAVMIDLGSIAKGYITDCLITFLQSRGVKECLIDARGDIRIMGEYVHILGIQHPRKKNKELCSLLLKNKAVATSGDYRQYTQTFKNSHIFNQKEVSSISVVANTLEEADVMATALFVTDKTQREKIIKMHPSLQIITYGTEINMYNGFEKLRSDYERK